MTFSKHSRGLLIALGGVLLLTPDTLLLRLIDMDHWTMLVWRGLLSGLATIVLARFILGVPLVPAVRRLGSPGWVATLALTVSSILFIVALSYTSVANVLVALASTPLFAALIDWLVFHQRPPLRTWVAVLCGFAGIAIAAGGNIAVSDVSGIAITLVAASTLALTLCILRHNGHVSNLAVVGLAGILSGLAVLPMAELTPVDGVTLVYLLAMGLIIMPIPFLAMTYGVRDVPSAEISLIMLLETVLGPFWVWLVIGEPVATATIIGGAVLIATLAVHAWAAIKANRAGTGLS